MFLRYLLGRKLSSGEERTQRVGVASGVSVFGLDALGSAAYGPEAALTVLLAAGDVCSELLPACEQVRRWAPDVEWRGGPEYDEDPWRSLSDTSRARVLLGWEATRTWPRGRAGSSR